MGSKAGKAVPIVVLVGAFVIRLIFILEVRNLPLYYHPVLDSDFFNQWAAFKRQISWLDASATFREPGYAYLLALIYSVFRDSMTIVRLLQCAIGSLTAFLVYVVTTRIYGRVAGIAAGVVFAFYGSAIFFTSEINETTLAVFLVVLSAYLLTRAATSRPYMNSGLSGVFLGAAFLTRFTVVAALPAWIVHLIICRDPKIRRTVPVLLIGVVMLPAIYQAAALRGGDRAIFPLRAGWQAFLGSGVTGGTTPGSGLEIGLGGPQGAYRALAASSRIDGQRDALRFARIETSSDVSGAAAARHWQQRTLEDSFADPGRYLLTYLKKIGLFFGPSEPPANVDMRFVSRYAFLLRKCVFSFAVVAPLGLIGLVTSARRESLYAAMFIPLCAGVTSAYLVSDADKLLSVPFLSVFAGGLVSSVVRDIGHLRILRALVYVVVAAVAGLVLRQLPYSDLEEADQLVILGDVYSAEAIYERAEEAYEEAIKASPDAPGPRLALARLRGNSGRVEEGIDVLGAAASQGISNPRLRIEKAAMLATAGRPGEALEELQGLDNSYPYEPRLHQVTGVSLLELGETARAAEELEKELSYVGGGFITYSALGRAKLALGDLGEAATYLESALALNPYNTSVAMQLADTYTRLDEHLKACEILSRVLTVDPGNMPLRFKFANCLYRAGRLADALKHFGQLSNFDPGNSDYVLNMGTVYAEMDSLDRAVEMWEKALVLDPGNEMALQNLKTARQDYE